MKKTWVVIPSLIEIRIVLSNNMQKGEYDSLHRKRSTDSSSCWISRICENRLISRVERTWQKKWRKNFDRSDILIIGGIANIHSVMILPQDCVHSATHNHSEGEKKNLQTADKLKSYKVVHLNLSGFHNWKHHLIDQKLIFLPFRIKQHDKHLLSPDSKSNQTVNMLFSKP